MTSKNRFVSIGLIPSLLILNGCSNPSDANIDTMKAAIQLGIDDINCLKIPSQFGSEGELKFGYPEVCESLERMTEEGILVRERDEVVKMGIYKTAYWAYRPSAEHLHEFKLKKAPYEEYVMFCPGKPKVAEVTDFTVPAEQNGVKMSMVAFNWKVDLPQPIQKLYDAGVFRKGFSKSCEPFDPFYYEIKLGGHGNMSVMLTNNGWKPAKTFSE